MKSEGRQGPKKGGRGWGELLELSGPVAVQLDLRPRPKVHVSVQTRLASSDPQGLAAPPLRLQAAGGHGEPRPGPRINEGVGDDTVGAGVQPGGKRVVVGKGEGGKRRPDAFGLDAVAEVRVDVGEELRMALEVVGSKTVHGDDEESLVAGGGGGRGRGRG